MLNNELPLKINNIVGLDETFRYTNVFPPLPALFTTDLHINLLQNKQIDSSLLQRPISNFSHLTTTNSWNPCQNDDTTNNGGHNNSL